MQVSQLIAALKQRESGESWRDFCFRLGEVRSSELYKGYCYPYKYPAISNFGCNWLRYSLSRSSDVHKTDFSGLDLSDANLTSANFLECDLRNTNLSGCNLNYVKFKGADLRGADVSNANLVSTKGLSEAKTKGIKGLTGTKKEEKDIAMKLLKIFTKDPYLLQNLMSARRKEWGENDLLGWVATISGIDESYSDLSRRFPTIAQYHSTYEEETIKLLRGVAHGLISVFGR